MNISLSIFLHNILKTRTRPKCSFNNGNFCWKTFNKSSVVVFVYTYPLSEKTKCQFSLILILDQPQYNLSCNTKAGNGKPCRWLCQSQPSTPLLAWMECWGNLRTGPTFCWLYIKNGAYIGNSCFVHNTSFAGLTTIVIVYALILIMTEIKCKNCNETLNIFTPSKVYLYGCVKFS